MRSPELDQQVRNLLQQYIRVLMDNTSYEERIAFIQKWVDSLPPRTSFVDFTSTMTAVALSVRQEKIAHLFLNDFAHANVMHRFNRKE